MISKIIQDDSRYQQYIDYPLLKSKGQSHIVHKAGSGSLSTDAKFEQHYTGTVAAQMIPDAYFWHDPIYDALAQSVFFTNISKSKKLGFVELDFEQWWKDWAKWQQWKNEVIPQSQVPIVPADQLFNHFVSVHQYLIKNSGYEVITYTAAWFLNAYCPQAYDYLKDYWTHWADYSLFSTVKVKTTWEYLETIQPIGKKIPTLPANYPLDKVLMWQWSGDKFVAPGVYADEAKTRLSDLDLNLWINNQVSINDISKYDSGGNTVPIPIEPVKAPFINSSKSLRVLNVPYVPQIGETANEYSNDCGAASGVMLVEAYTNNTPTVDEFYKKTGSTIDAYLSATQIIKVLSSYGVGSKWLISNMTDLLKNLNAGKSPICLILYSVLRDAGLTQSSFGGFHFVVAVGYDTEKIYIHDPLWSNDGGKELAVPYATFEKAWKDAGANPMLNPAYGCIVPNYAIGGNTPTSSYKVTATTLYVRSTPDSSSPANIVGKLYYGNIVQITEINSNNWGKIYGSGYWISMAYTVKV